MENEKTDNEKCGNLQFLGAADLVKRLCYSKQGVHNMIRNKTVFPKPCGAINNGRADSSFGVLQISSLMKWRKITIKT